MKNNLQYVSKIGPLIYEAYYLTSKILQELGIIPSVGYTFTYHGNNTFYRSQNVVIDPQKDLNFELHRESLVIRLKEAEIKNKILANQSEKNVSWVSDHYQNFIEPLKKAKSEKFKLNYGIVSEAFERHWEELHHSLENPKDDDFGGVGHIWKLYWESSGNDPYYTGPDTVLSQVKNANASIISNADTVLNTLQAVLVLINTKTTSLEEANALQQKFALSFTQRKSETSQISKKIWDAVDEDTKKLILKEFNAVGVDKIKKNIVIFR